MNFLDLQQWMVINKLKGGTSSICLVRCYGKKSGEIIRIRKRNRSWIDVHEIGNDYICIRKVVANKGATTKYVVRGVSYIDGMLHELSMCEKVPSVNKSDYATFKVL